MKILAVIPARSGSKGVVGKNIRDMAGKPTLAHSIEHAQQSKYINRIIVSTDSEEYAKIAKSYGAEIPFIRPAEYATDTALDYEVFLHALTFLRDTEGYEPDLVVQLRPTYPVRDVEEMDRMIEIMMANEQADSLRTIALAKEIPHKMWKMGENNHIHPLLTDIPEGYNMPRRELPKVYYQNACVDVFRPRCIWEYQSMTGRVVFGYEMEQNYDIDTEEEFRRTNSYMKMMKGGQRFVFDIDGVIMQFDPKCDYANALPNERMIKVIRKLYAAGNEIILHTARGYVTGMDWKEVTEEQLKKYDVPYHELHFGKPNADYYVDDKMFDMNDLMDLFE